MKLQKSMLNTAIAAIFALGLLGLSLPVHAAEAATAETKAPEAKDSAPAVKTEPAAAPAEKDTKKNVRRKRAIKMADDKEDTVIEEKDPSTYQLSNKRIIEDYTAQDLRPYDRGEHILISAFMGGIGGGVVGGLIGLNGYDKNNDTTTLNALYKFGGIGAGVGVFTGITLTFFERGKIEQFALGKFLLKYSWYGAIGGGLIGAGVGLIPYSSSSDHGDIIRYAGYGAGVGLVASLVLFFIDLPDHLKLFTYQREGQNVFVLTLRF